MAIHPMSSVDAAWFHMDGAVNDAVVTAMLTTRRRLDFAAVREIFLQRFATIPRFHQRVVETGIAMLTPHWEDMPDFDIAQHLHHRALAAPNDKCALEALLDDLASQPLPHDMPLWQADVVDGPGRGSALIMRYHHCIGDGMAMMTVARRLFDGPAPPPPAAARKATPRGAQAEGAVASIGTAIAALERGAFDVIGAAGSLAAQLLKRPDSPSPFKGEFVRRQRLARSNPFAVADLKAIGTARDATINDVLVAATAGALRSYLQQHGLDADHATLRAMVPVNLRPPERAEALGNEFGLVMLELPVDVADPARRIAAAKMRMDALKQSPQSMAMRWLLDLFGAGPKALQGAAQHLFGVRSSAVLSNVIGPRKALRLAGVPIESMAFWVPHPGEDVGIGLSLMSYRGLSSLAVIADARLVPDPEAIVHAFEHELDRMRRLPPRPGRRSPARRTGAAART